MGYLVPTKGGNSSYIVRDLNDYPDKFEPMISEYAQLLTDINNGIALVSGISTGAEYFEYLATATGGSGAGNAIEEYSGNVLTIDDTTANNYHNKRIVMTGTQPPNTVTLAVNNRSSIDDNFFLEVVAYGGSLLLVNTGVNNYIYSPVAQGDVESELYDITKIILAPGTGLNFMVSSYSIAAAVV